MDTVISLIRIRCDCSACISEMPFPSLTRHTAATSNLDGYEPVETVREERAAALRRIRVMRRKAVIQNERAARA
jgi:hypothetical protein